MRHRSDPQHCILNCRRSDRARVPRGGAVSAACRVDGKLLSTVKRERRDLVLSPDLLPGEPVDLYEGHGDLLMGQESSAEVVPATVRVWFDWHSGLRAEAVADRRPERRPSRGEPSWFHCPASRFTSRADTTAMKWLLAQLFGLPTTPEHNKVYGDARRAVTDEFDRLGWATKVDRDNSPVAEGTHQTRTARYLLHRELDLPT